MRGKARTSYFFKDADKKPSTMRSKKILFIATCRDTMGNTGDKTGIWLGDLGTSYHILQDAGADVTLVSPNEWRCRWFVVTPK
jgi:hypothetical protein